MLKRLLPAQKGFFELFQKIADTTVQTTEAFQSLLSDLKNQQPHVDAIAAYEAQADKLVHVTFELLHKTFITPFDRHDIHQLTSKLDDVLDHVNRCAQRFPFYHIESVPNEMLRLAELSVECSQLLKKAVYCLDSLDNSTVILQYCEDINTLESHAHALVLVGEKNLFLDENDFKTFYKLKDIYTKTKSVINSCQDVSNIIKGIVLEYS